MPSLDCFFSPLFLEGIQRGAGSERKERGSFLVFHWLVLYMISLFRSLAGSEKRYMMD